MVNDQAEQGARQEHETLLGSIEHMKARAGRVQQELMELHNSARFDHRLPGVAQRAARIESEARALCSEVEELRNRLDQPT